MRRRRQKNTLLPKMIGLAVVINAILLPILAQFGVFKSIGGQRLTPVELVTLPPVPKPPAEPKKTVKKTAAKPHPAGHRAAPRQLEAHRVPTGPVVKVVAVGPSANGSGGTGDSGIAPSDSGASGPLPPPVNPPVPPPPVPPPPVELTPPPVVVPPTPVVTPMPLAPHIPVLTAAEPLSQPQPSLPDELRDADLSANFEALFTVHTDGTASVKVVSGTGNSALDALALEAARHWTFRPATRDGQPVESYRRLRVEFRVDS